METKNEYIKPIVTTLHLFSKEGLKGFCTYINL